MSDKGLLFKKRKNNHGSHHKCSKGSGFPRHSMNHYPGTHLGMKLRYSKPSVGRLYCEWGPNRGYLRTNRITGFINKFIGKPYNDLVKAFYALIKDLRDSHKEGYYYSSYPQRWDRKGYCDRFSDMFRPGDSAFKWAQGVENGWVVPIIPFSKRSEWYGLRYAMYKRMYHSKLVLMPNTKELTSVRELVQRCREHLSQCEDPENWWYGKTERCQKELDEALEKLRKTPNMAYFEVGYGQLYPMVKRYDYEKALRIYEQEQKETSMEGQE